MPPLSAHCRDFHARPRPRHRRPCLKQPQQHEHGHDDEREQGQQQQQQQQRRHHRVTFYDGVRAKRALHLGDYTPEELRACWYTKEDVAERHASISKELQRLGVVTMTSSCPSPINGETARTEVHHNPRLRQEQVPRGLEQHVKSLIIRRNRAIYDGQCAVLDEQELQDDEDICVPEMIAAVYADVTNEATARAYTRGLMDQQQAVLAYRTADHHPPQRSSKSSSRHNDILIAKEDRRRDVVATGTPSEAGKTVIASDKPVPAPRSASFSFSSSSSQSSQQLSSAKERRSKLLAATATATNAEDGHPAAPKRTASFSDYCNSNALREKLMLAKQMQQKGSGSSAHSRGPRSSSLMMSSSSHSRSSLASMISASSSHHRRRKHRG